MTDVQNISAAIVQKVQGVSGIQNVYDYIPDKPTDGKYPYATVTPERFEGEFADTIRNKRVYTFVLGVYQERTEAGFGNQKAERLIREITDEILTAFDADTTLSGMVKYIKPVRGDLSYDDGETGDRRVAQFDLEAMNVVPSIT